MKRTPLPHSNLPTSFRKSFSLSLQVELCDLLTRLHGEHGVNLSAELEPLIKRKAARIARKINEKRR